MTEVLARVIGAVGLLASLAVAAMLVVAPDLPGIRTLAATGAVGLAGWLYLDWPTVAGWLTSRGGAELARALALVVVLVAVAGVGVRIANRLGVRWDLTPARAHSVQLRTQEVLGELRGAVSITAFFIADGDAIERAHRARWIALSEAFEAAAPRLAIATLDPDVSRREADQAGVRTNGVVLVTAGERTERLFGPDEASLLNAILRVASARDRTVYVSAGSGERSVHEGGRLGLSVLARRLRELGLGVESLDLLRSEVPADAAAILLIDPSAPLGGPAAARLASWIDDGGAALVALERGRPSGLEDQLAAWGLARTEELIVDPLVRAVVGDATTPLVAEYGLHEAVRGLRAPAVFPGASPVEDAPHDPARATVHVLARTSALAWGESQPDEEPAQGPDDRTGPLSLISLVELHPNGTAGGRVVLSGDADWLSDPAIEQLGNADLAVRLVGFLGHQTDLVTLPPRERQTGTLTMDWMARVVLGLVAVLLVPGLCFGTAAGLWMWRRRL